MENATLPPPGDLSVDPTRDQPQKDGGNRYLKWNLGVGESFDENERAMLVSLGAAVVSCWENLPRDVQESLFEAAAGPHSPDARSAVATFLHTHGEHHG